MNSIIERPKGVGWVCFHCGERFYTPDGAEIHFGASQLSMPACRIKAGEEHNLVVALRAAETELERYRAEDSDKDRQMGAMTADHQTALRREEERGYARGLADGQAIRVAEPSRCKNPVTRGESKEAGASTGDVPVASASTFCEDCPPVGYPTDETRCAPCPHRR